MGAVYRARDTKLDRDVAVKVLPEALAQDAERLARFEREAKVLASLNHPHIAAIYGVEERALIMELVEGQAPKGPLPLAEARAIASQMADALEYAHGKGRGTLKQAAAGSFRGTPRLALRVFLALRPLSAFP